MTTSRRGRTSSRTTTNGRAKAVEDVPSVELADMASPDVVESEPEVPEVSEPVEANQEETVKASEAVLEEPKETPVTAIEEPQTITSTKEEPMSTPDVIEATATPAKGDTKNGAIQIHQEAMSLSIWNRPVMPSDIEIVGEIQSAGTRPIEASHLAVFGTILNGRPILSSSLKVAEMLPGGRPIFFSDFHGVEGADLPGGRPIMVSQPGLLAASTLPGGRPIFANDADDALTLMGYID
jgi:hypothetical protein